MSDGAYLNLGCGGQIANGWINVDRDGLPIRHVVGATVVAVDLNASVDCLVLDLTEPWPWKNGMVDGIAMHHVLDLFDDEGYWHVLDEAHRVLKLGGVLRISLAHLKMGILKAMAGQWEWFPEPQYAGRSDGHFREDDIFNGPLTLGFFLLQGGARKQWLTPHELTESLKTTFVHAYAMSYGHTNGDGIMVQLDSREAESFFVEAIR